VSSSTAPPQLPPPPILLGFLHDKGDVFYLVEALHPNALVARAFGNTAGFSFNSLPTNTELCWNSTTSVRVVSSLRANLSTMLNV
jgi:hypothetical protein